MAATEYRLADGTQVSGVTTVIGEWQETAFGGFRNDAIERSAENGTQVHALIHRAICGTGAKGLAVHEESHPEVMMACASWVLWCSLRKPKFVGSEMQMVSEKMRVGGTLDTLAWVDGELWNIDWKTSLKAEPSARLQLTGYSEIHREVDPLNATDNCMIVRLNKRDGIGGEEVRWEKSPTDVRLWNHCVDLHHARDGFKKRHKDAVRRTF